MKRQRDEIGEKWEDDAIINNYLGVINIVNSNEIIATIAIYSLRLKALY